MFKRQFISITASTTIIASLFLMSGCGKQKEKPSTPKDKITVANKTVKVRTISTSPNLIINHSFEKGKTFTSRLYKEGKKSIKKPVGWTTEGQVLNDSSGWTTDKAHSGKYSLTIKNIGGTRALWKGSPIIFKKPVNSFKTSIWTKTKDIADKNKNGKFQLFLEVYIKSANNIIARRTVAVDIAKNNHIWEKTSGEAVFLENIVKIIPYLYFSGMTGTVWFDDCDLKVSDYNFGPNLVNNLKLTKDKKEPTKWITNNHKLAKWNNTGKTAILELFSKDKNTSIWWSSRQPVILSEPGHRFYFGGIAKIISKSAKSIPVLDFSCYFDDGTKKTIRLKFSKKHSGWQKIEKIISFDKKVIKINSSFCFYNAKGSAFCKEIFVKKIKIGE